MAMHDANGREKDSRVTFKNFCEQGQFEALTFALIGVIRGGRLFFDVGRSIDGASGDHALPGRNTRVPRALFES